MFLHFLLVRSVFRCTLHTVEFRVKQLLSRLHAINNILSSVIFLSSIEHGFCEMYSVEVKLHIFLFRLYLLPNIGIRRCRLMQVLQYRMGKNKRRAMKTMAGYY